jgi:hypothetical protein
MHPPGHAGRRPALARAGAISAGGLKNSLPRPRIGGNFDQKKISSVGNRAYTWRIIEDKQPQGEACGDDNVMTIQQSGSFDPETIALLRTVLDQAWERLSPEQQSCTSKSDLAERILRLAAQGERNLIRLRALAVLEVVLAT